MAAPAAAELAFRVRSALPWSLRPPQRPLLRLDALRSGLAAEGRERWDALAKVYDLTPLQHAPGRQEAMEALWAADVLDRLLGPGLARLPAGPAMDVGAKNGVHLPGQRCVRPGPWDLVEIDAHRRYVDFTTRGAHGQAMVARFRGCRYLAADVCDVHGRYGLITWFLPFVVDGPHRAWGLPARLFRPRQTLRHVLSLLMTGGALVIVNQGPAEAEAQAALLAEADDVLVDAVGALPATLSPYRHPRFAFVVRRRGV